MNIVYKRIDSVLHSLPNIKFLVQTKMKEFADDKIELWLGKRRKPCGERRKCWLLAISPFPTMFSRAVFVRVVKSWGFVVKS